MTNETEKGGNVLHFQQSIFKYRFQFGKTKFRQKQLMMVCSADEVTVNF